MYVHISPFLHFFITFLFICLYIYQTDNDSDGTWRTQIDVFYATAKNAVNVRTIQISVSESSVRGSVSEYYLYVCACMRVWYSCVRTLIMSTHGMERLCPQLMEGECG